MPRSILYTGAGVAFAGAVWTALSPKDAGLSLLLVAFALVAAGFAWVESGPGSAKEVANHSRTGPENGARASWLTR